MTPTPVAFRYSSSSCTNSSPLCGGVYASICNHVHDNPNSTRLSEPQQSIQVAVVGVDSTSSEQADKVDLAGSPHARHQDSAQKRRKMG